MVIQFRQREIPEIKKKKPKKIKKALSINARKKKRKEWLKNNAGRLVISACVFLMTVTAGVATARVKMETKEKKEEIKMIEKEIKEEEQKNKNLKEYEQYVKARPTEFVEKMAREKLGLVYPNELVFKNTHND